MKIYLATDHAGFEMKEELVPYLQELGHEVEDFGAYEYNESDDFPDFIALAARAVSENSDGSRAIILGGSGQGEAMLANRFPGVRATVLYSFDEEIIKLSREHNNANVLSFGARFLSTDHAKQAVRLWLETDFTSDPRHVRRIKKLEALEVGSEKE